MDPRVYVLAAGLYPETRLAGDSERAMVRHRRLRGAPEALVLGEAGSVLTLPGQRRDERGVASSPFLGDDEDGGPRSRPVGLFGILACSTELLT